MFSAQKINKIVNIWYKLLKDDIFYLPVLGPVFVFGKPVRKILYDILENSKTDKFLSYDKNKRWFKKKKERIILSEILIERNQLLIPVESFSKNKTLKIFYYSSKKINNRIIKKIKNFIIVPPKFKNINNYFLYSFLKPKIFKKLICHNIYLKMIKKKDKLEKNFENICYFNDLSPKTKQTLSLFKKEPELQGFAFLWRRFANKKRILSPIICAVEKDKIIGAIGPLEILNDAWNNKWLAPPYFGVKKDFRSKGYGKKLWKTAMSFAHQKGAKYTLVQNEPDSPAAKFYEKQGLKKAAKVYSLSL